MTIEALIVFAFALAMFMVWLEFYMQILEHREEIKTKLKRKMLDQYSRAKKFISKNTK